MKAKFIIIAATIVTSLLSYNLIGYLDKTIPGVEGMGIVIYRGITGVVIGLGVGWAFSYMIKEHTIEKKKHKNVFDELDEK
jgi:hypothetical protein